MVVARSGTGGWEKGGIGTYYLMGRVSVWDNKKVLEINA